MQSPSHQHILHQRVFDHTPPFSPSLPLLHSNLQTPDNDNTKNCSGTNTPNSRLQRTGSTSLTRARTTRSNRCCSASILNRDTTDICRVLALIVIEQSGGGIEDDIGTLLNELVRCNKIYANAAEGILTLYKLAPE